jgi:hypothetical protein
MKKYLLCAFLFVSVSGFPQTEKPITKGNMMIGGNLSFASNDIHMYHFSLDASPSFGYFLFNNFAVGLDVPVQYMRLSQLNEYSIGVSPFVKYYANNGLFATFKYGEHFNRYISTTTMSMYDSRNFSLTTGIGYSYFIGNKVSLEGGIYHEYYKYRTTDYGENNFSLRFGFQIFL